MSVEDTIDGLAIIQQKRGRIVDQGDVEMLAQAIRELRKGRPGTVRAEVATTGSLKFGMNQDGTLDELYATNARLHIEQMSATHWWMAVEVGKKRIDIGLHSKATIKANVSDEGDEPTEIPSYGPSSP